MDVTRRSTYNWRVQTSRLQSCPAARVQWSTMLELGPLGSFTRRTHLHGIAGNLHVARANYSFHPAPEGVGLRALR